MKRLILMRHAKSDWSAGVEDHARPLNPRGIKSAEAMGDWLRAGGHIPDAVLCSSARRTRETLEGLRVTAPTRFDRALYHVSPEAMLEVLQAAEGETVLLIGHNPGIGDFAASLVSRRPDHPRFEDYPTCATLVAGFAIQTWRALRPGLGEVVDFAVPREIMAR